jgi:hypothetical protein
MGTKTSSHLSLHRVRQIHVVKMIQRSLVEFDLDVVTAQSDTPSGVPVLLALGVSGRNVLGWEKACPTA